MKAALCIVVAIALMASAGLFLELARLAVAS